MLSYYFSAQTTYGVDQVVFVNQGKMYVGGDNSNAVLFLPAAVKMRGTNVNIMQVGKSVLAGNFYQDAEGPIFNESGEGTVVFRNIADEQVIMYSAADFDRGLNYVAFPAMEIEKDTFLRVVSKMGIDTKSLTRVSGRKGALYLESSIETDVGDPLIYDASFRYLGDTAIDPGLVVVERYVDAYRGTDYSDCILFPFATPFAGTQRAGYFAGNWLRTPVANDGFGGSPYPMANKGADQGGTIGLWSEQYVYNANVLLEAGKPYYLRLRPKGEYNLEYKITIADEADREIETFVFDGEAFNLPVVQEQLFTNDILFTGSINNVQPEQTVNWVIGNSYTSPLSLTRIMDKMSNSSLMFSPILYVFYTGQTTFTPVSAINQTPALIDRDEIPSMGVFMLRVSKNYVQNGTFQIGREDRIHGKISHNLKAASPVYPDILFRVYPVSNPFLNDLAVIGVRENAKSGYDDLDIEKPYNEIREVFQMYTLSSDGVRLSSNAIPESVTQVPLCMVPGQGHGVFRIEASRLETMSEYDVWLEDLYNGNKINLRKTKGYEFETGNYTEEQRFIVHFGPRSSENVEEVYDETDIYVYSVNGELVINELSKNDMGNNLTLIGINGNILSNTQINDYPVMKVPVNMPRGIYIVQISGKDRKYITKIKL